MRNEALRDAYQSLAGSSSEACSADDLERVWQAVSGQSGAAERRALVERMATDRGLAEAWRVAAELWRLSGGQPAVAPAPPAWRRLWPLAAAAVVTLAVTGSWFVMSRSPGDAVRDQPGVTITSLLAADAALPREMFRLRWTPAPAGSRYDVRVTTEDLRVIATANDVSEAELAIEPARFAGVLSGSRVLWQVDAVLPGGARVSSPTFVAVVR